MKLTTNEKNKNNIFNEIKLEKNERKNRGEGEFKMKITHIHIQNTHKYTERIIQKYTLSHTHTHVNLLLIHHHIFLIFFLCLFFSVGIR